MFGRVADLRYRQTTMASMSLAEKLEEVLDLILPTCLNADRREVTAVAVEESMSDEDY